MLALRDELRSRQFDVPAEWWPQAPGVIGGRDRQAGGTWCASNIRNGVTGVVLNRPERPLADVGAPSRGVLPLLAARHGAEWPAAVELAGMASFNLVLAGPGTLSWWSYDGERLERSDLAGGTYMFTPRGIAAATLDARFTAPGSGFSGNVAAAPEDAWAGWLSVVLDSTPSDDPQSLLVRRPIGDDVFETVFGQFIAARPERLRLDYLIHPAARQPWSTRVWGRD
jgi:hypothetical protein